ncbi:MAG: hypothetical protein M0024_07540 [Nitrospiraceae bacterium]|nr:hypothetical protein [Nitrospiraceae bacterium]
MKILHILNDGPEPVSSSIIEIQARDHELTVIDLAKKEKPYEEIVGEIFSHDRVISW